MVKNKQNASENAFLKMEMPLGSPPVFQSSSGKTLALGLKTQMLQFLVLQRYVGITVSLAVTLMHVSSCLPSDFFFSPDLW